MRRGFNICLFLCDTGVTSPDVTRDSGGRFVARVIWADGFEYCVEVGANINKASSSILVQVSRMIR